MNLPSFDAVAAVLLIPIGSAALLAALPGYRLTARLNVVASLATFLSALSLFVIDRPAPGPYVLIDDLNIVFIVLNTFVGFTTSIFSASYIAHELETGRLTPVYLRFYHAMYQTMMFGMNLAFVSNNIGLMWVAVEIATLTTVLMVGIYRTHAALEAAWKYFILGSVGIALALFGTILVYMAARPVVGEGQDGMVWTLLIEHAANFDPALLNVAFVFLFLGYGTKVGLAPLHAWLPDAHAEGPTPISAVLSGLLLNVALYALLRFKILMAANPAAIAPGPLMVTMGLVSLVFAAFMLYRRRDIKRLFAYSSIEHMGIIVFAFGMGGPLANFAGLLHMVMHSLTKSAIFYAVGHISQIKGTQRINRIRGLTVTHPALGWGLVVGVVAIAGLPPLGIFMSEFLVVSSTFARQPLLAIVLVFGLLLAFGALMLRLTSVAFGEPRGSTAPADASYVPMFAHLALVLARGHLSSRRRSSSGSSTWPGFLDRSERDMPSLIDLMLEGREVGQHRPWPRVVVDASIWDFAASELAQGRWSLLGLWGEPARCTWRSSTDRPRTIAVVSLDCPDRTYPSVGQHHPPALRLERTVNDLFGLSAESSPDTRPWLDHNRWGVRFPLGDRIDALPGRRPTVSCRGRRRPAPDCCRSRACGHHRARTFPLYRQRRDRGPAGTAARIRPQGHRGADGRRQPRAGRQLAGRVSGDSTVAYAYAFSRAAEAALDLAVPDRAVWLRALLAELERLANHLGDIGAICNDASFTLMHAHCSVLRESVLRAADTAFGHRLMRDIIVPGGVSRDLGDRGGNHPGDAG